MIGTSHVATYTVVKLWEEDPGLILAMESPGLCPFLPLLCGDPKKLFVESRLVALGITNMGVAFTLLSLGIKTGPNSSLRHGDPIWVGVPMTAVGAWASLFLGGMLHVGRSGSRDATAWSLRSREDHDQE